MKKIFLPFVVFSSISLAAQNGSVGINTDQPDASAALHITSSDKGILIPRLSTTERTAIVEPANGLLVYDTVTNSFWLFKNSLWTEIISGSPTFSTKTEPYTLTVADSGKVLEFNSANNIQCIIPVGLPPGLQFSVTQLGAGNVIFVAASGVNLRNAYGFTRSALQYSKVGIEVASNSDVIISGDLK